MNFNDILSVVLDTAKQSAGNIRNPSQSTADTITKVGSGAALAGILSMVFGRSGGASLTKLGSLAALGSIAYQAYQAYQKNQAESQTLTASEFEGDAEQKSALILRTMIAAAISDGDLDEHEKNLIQQESGNDPELYQWVSQEIQNPISVNEIARIVGNDVALASQVYLAARMVCKDLSRKEIIFLSQLAAALKLDDALVEQLEKQAGY